MKINFLYSTLVILATYNFSFAQGLPISVKSTQPLVQQELEVTVTKDYCKKYNGYDSCLIQFYSLKLPPGGKVVSVLPSTDPNFKFSLNYSGEPALSGINIESKAAILDPAVEAGTIKFTLIYNGAAIK